MKLRIGGAMVAIAAILALAGCDNSSGDNISGNNSSGNGQATAGDAQQQYRDCLSRNGVTLPSTRPSGFPANRPTVRPSDFPRVRPAGSAGTGLPGNGNGDGPAPGDANGPGGGALQGIDASAFAKAQEACASVRPSGVPGFGRPGGGDGRNAAYRNCLREHGVTLEDGRQPDASDPKVAAALQTCAVLKPSPSPAN